MTTSHKFLLMSTTLLLGSAAAVGAQTLRIGLANPATGDYAPYGEGTGAQCMADIINEDGGDITVDILIEDSRSDPQLTLSLTQRFLDAGAVIVHGTPFPDSLIPMAGMARAYESIVYSPQITQVEMHEANLGNFVAGVAPDDAAASAMATTLHGEGVRTAVLMTSQDAGSWSAGTPEWFGEALERLGGEVIGRFNHSIGTNDWSPQITEIQRLPVQPDVVYICSVVPDVGILARQLVNAGYEGLIAGCDGFDDPSLEATVGSEAALAQVRFSTHVETTGDTPAAAFLQECRDRGYRVNGVFDALGGDMVRLLVDAADRAGTTENGNAILTALRESGPFDLMTGGTLSFAEHGSWPERAIPIIGFEDGARMTVSYDAPEFLPRSQ